MLDAMHRTGPWRRTGGRPRRAAIASIGALTPQRAMARRSRGRGRRRGRSTPCSGRSRGGRRRRGAGGRRPARSSARRRRAAAARWSDRSPIVHGARRASASLGPVTRRPAASGSPRCGRAARAAVPWSTAMTMAPAAAASCRSVARSASSARSPRAPGPPSTIHTPTAAGASARRGVVAASSVRAAAHSATSSAGSTGTSPPAGEAITNVQPTWRRASLTMATWGSDVPVGRSDPGSRPHEVVTTAAIGSTPTGAPGTAR